MEKRKRLVPRMSIPHAYFVDEDYDDHASPVDIGAALAGSTFVIALLIGSLAVICVSVALIVKCVKGIAAIFTDR